MIALIRSYGLLALGWGMVGLGIVLAPLPIPVGLPLMAAGIYLLARESRRVRHAIARLRARFPGFSAGLQRRAAGWPGSLRRFVSLTEPGRVLTFARRRAGMLRARRLRRRRIPASDVQAAE